MTMTRQAMRRTAMAAALLALFEPAWADDADSLTDPNRSSVSAGGSHGSGDKQDRSLFGQYNGLYKDDSHFLLDFEYVVRDPDTGTWTIVRGKDLGLDTRELSFLYGPQGRWKIHGEYWGLTHYSPRSVNTGETGIETTTPTISLLSAPGSGGDSDLKIKRKRFELGGQRWINPQLMVELDFTNEKKDGARLFGRGYNCPSGAAPAPLCTALANGANQWALLMVPEPISSTTRQADVKIHWFGKDFTVVGGYYGTFYNDDYASLVPTVNGNLNNGLGVPMGQGGGVPLTAGLRGLLQQPMALPPDNQAHQFYLDGNYAFSRTTQATFKYAYTHATQTQSFSEGGFDAPPAGRGDLGGRLDTNLVLGTVTSHPWSKLSLSGNVRYEDRKDKTPIDNYNVEGTSTFSNGHVSNKRLTGKVEATYAFPHDLRGTFGLDWDSIDRDQFTPTDQVAGLSGIRQKTYDRGYHFDVRKTMSADISGMLSWVHTERSGSSWLKPNAGTATGVFPADPDCASSGSNACIYSRTAIFPSVFENRKRDKLRFLLDWSPAEKVSVQLSADYGKDRYEDQPTEKGLDNTKLQMYGIDLAYRLSDAISLTAYYTYSEQQINVAHSTGYIADLKDKNNTAGIGVKGIANPRIQWGGDLLFIHDRNESRMGLDAAASAQSVAYFNSGMPFIPDATFRDLRIKLYGSYQLQKNADIRLEVVHDRTKLDEWQWGYNGIPFLFSDNTTVNVKPQQNATYVSVLYTYRFR